MRLKNCSLNPLKSDEGTGLLTTLINRDHHALEVKKIAKTSEKEK